MCKTVGDMLETANTVTVLSQTALDFSRHLFRASKRLCDCSVESYPHKTILRIAWIQPSDA